MENIDLQLNQSQCITYVSKFGEYHYYNICSGKMTTVPWGIAEYGAVSLSALFGLAMIAIVMFVFGLDVALIHRMATRSRK